MKKTICILLVVLSLVVMLCACNDENIVVLNSISIKNAPEKTVYYVGDSLDLTGGKLLVKYSDETEKEIDLTGSMISAVDMNTAGEKTVTVTYTENMVTKTTNFTITVKNKTVITEHLSAMLTDWYEKNDKYVLDTSVTFDNKVIEYHTWQKVTFTLYDGDRVLATAVSTGENLEALLEESEEGWVNKDTALTLSCAFATRSAVADNGKWVFSAFAATNESEEQPNRLTVEIETADKIYRTSFTVSADREEEEQGPQSPEGEGDESGSHAA